MAYMGRTMCVVIAIMLMITSGFPPAFSKGQLSPIPVDALLSASPSLVAGRADEAEELPRMDRMDSFLRELDFPLFAASTTLSRLQPVGWSAPLRWEARKPVGIHAPPMGDPRRT